MIHSWSDLTRDPGLFADNLVGASETHLGAHASYKGRSAPSEVRRLTRRLRLKNKRCLNKSGLARPNSNLRKGKPSAPYIACIDSGKDAPETPIRGRGRINLVLSTTSFRRNAWKRFRLDRSAVVLPTKAHGRAGLSWSGGSSSACRGRLNVRARMWPNMPREVSWQPLLEHEFIVTSSPPILFYRPPGRSSLLIRSRRPALENSGSFMIRSLICGIWMLPASKW